MRHGEGRETRTLKSGSKTVREGRWEVRMDKNEECTATMVVAVDGCRSRRHFDLFSRLASLAALITRHTRIARRRTAGKGTEIG
jgi:hypothetical protein